jgi:glycosyltransferase involved in cell wall biosynthesis
MRICFIADARSPIARAWIGYFAGREHEVHVLSTFPCAPDCIPGATIHCLMQAAPAASKRLRSAPWSADLHDGLAQPLKAMLLARRARRLVDRIAPSLVHSLRLPIEGYLGGALEFHPHVISAWGNDFTLYADRFRLHARSARRAIAGCDGFLADAQADLDRAARYGLHEAVPRMVVPGAGGVDRAIFRPGRCNEPALFVNPRGFRRYVRNDTFFAACRIVSDAHPEARFVGVAMEGWRPIEDAVRRLELGNVTTLTGPLSRLQMAELYQRAAVTVSPTEHDGTPNTLLEAMASGCLPVCGDLPSLREWISPGENGLLCDAGNAASLAEAMLRAIEDRALAARAAEQNPRLVAERADYAASMRQAEEFYAELL